MNDFIIQIAGDDFIYKGQDANSYSGIYELPKPSENALKVDAIVK